MERGNKFKSAVKKAQDRSAGCGGIAQTVPSFKVDGWDSTAKVSAPATVPTPLPARKHRVGRRYKLVC
jgi:hypothetical protein